MIFRRGAEPVNTEILSPEDYQKELYRYDGYGMENNKKKDVRIMGFCPYTQK